MDGETLDTLKYNAITRIVARISDLFLDCAPVVGKTPFRPRYLSFCRDPSAIVGRMAKSPPQEASGITNCIRRSIFVLRNRACILLRYAMALLNSRQQSIFTDSSTSMNHGGLPRNIISFKNGDIWGLHSERNFSSGSVSMLAIVADLVANVDSSESAGTWSLDTSPPP